jgi:hypothetical protein
LILYSFSSYLFLKLKEMEPLLPLTSSIASLSLSDSPVVVEITDELTGVETITTPDSTIVVENPSSNLETELKTALERNRTRSKVSN